MGPSFLVFSLVWLVRPLLVPNGQRQKNVWASDGLFDIGVEVVFELLGVLILILIWTMSKLKLKLKLRV